MANTSFTSKFTAAEVRAFNAIQKVLKADSREKKDLTAKEYYKPTTVLPFMQYFAMLKEKGGFTAQFGLDSVANGGSIKLSEKGRVTLFLEYADGAQGRETNFSFSVKLSTRIAELLGDTDFRSLGANGGIIALRDASPCWGKAFVGVNKTSGLTQVFN